MITVNIRYNGVSGSARAFAKEMMDSGTVAAIRAEEGNIRSEYYASLDDPETVMELAAQTILVRLLDVCRVLNGAG